MLSLQKIFLDHLKFMMCFNEKIRDPTGFIGDLKRNELRKPEKIKESLEKY